MASCFNQVSPRNERTKTPHAGSKKLYSKISKDQLPYRQYIYNLYPSTTYRLGSLDIIQPTVGNQLKEFYARTTHLEGQTATSEERACTCQKRYNLSKGPSNPKKPIAPDCGNHVGTMLEPCWSHAGTMLESCWNPVGTMLEPCWNHAGTMLEPCWNHVGTTLEPCWNQVGISKKLPTPSSDKLDAAKLNTEMLGAINWPHGPR